MDVVEAAQPQLNEQDWKSRVLPLALCLLFVSIPFLAVTFPPITDLPQQVAQVQMAGEILDGSRTDAVILWSTPNKLSYALIAGVRLFAPDDAGRISMLLLALGWVLAVHFLAALHNRSDASATLASVLIFNQSLYWGFYSFLVGTPLFLLWVVVVSPERVPKRSWLEICLIVGLSGLLYYTHALWFAAGVAWFVFVSILKRPVWKTTALRALGLLPLTVIAIRWYLWLRDTAFGSETIWGPLPWERLHPEWLVNSVLGGLRGSFELVMVAAVVFWIGIGSWRHRRVFRQQCHFEWVQIGIVLFAGVLFLPIFYSNTLSFAERWAPIAAGFFLLGVPAPQIKPTLERWGSLVLVGAFCLFTAAQWIQVEVVEYSGLNTALEALPPNERVMGLDFVQRSPTLKQSRPFLQLFSYAQSQKGAELNFSFGDFASGLVAYDPPREHRWKYGLEWFPERAEESDLLAFSYLIVGGGTKTHDRFGSMSVLEPVTEVGLWRLYRVTADAP